jgi:hypothetical protein
MQGKLFIGVDVSKDWIDIAIAGQAKTHRLANTEAAIQDWISRSLDASHIGLVVFEPTGGYERILRRCPDKEHALETVGQGIPNLHRMVQVVSQRFQMLLGGGIIADEHGRGKCCVNERIAHRQRMTGRPSVFERIRGRLDCLIRISLQPQNVCQRAKRRGPLIELEARNVRSGAPCVVWGRSAGCRP